jgi:ubiquinol-cytochrome c reductase cytochrome c1 subunit
MTRFACAAVVASLAFGVPALAEEAAPLTPPPQSWSFTGPLGTVDQAAAQRGFQIYAEACANCHGLKYLHYRDLGGIGFTPAQIQAVAAKFAVPTGFDNQGNIVVRSATPASSFRPPFPNDEAAREMLNGALPPDLSLIVSTFPNGPNYIYALLTGYAEPPVGTKLADGMNYNPYFPGHQIAMPPPLNEGDIIYADGTASTVPQNAKDIVTFLAWAAHPEMVQRKHIGFGVVLYFLGMAGVTFVLKRRIWDNVHS